ncbi:hypothetical protein PV433_08615 [Paenibacillus sp. GYB004]|uniref:HAD family hydrolase n=1 Tax=Paenibacillus sp. GYB004 TaxID=2994393 RepID=UPI002F966702
MESAELGDIPEQHLWKRDIVLRRLDPLIGGLRLISFDVFDTLLFRCCSRPADVFDRTARKAAELGLFTRPTTDGQFRTLRMSAEKLAREQDVSGFGETTLERIYEHMPVQLGDRTRLLQLELETERELIFVNPYAASLIRFCKDNGIGVALLSDMYLSGKQIASFLTANGMDASLLDAVLVSSEEGFGKRSGRLYDSLLSVFPHINRTEIVHIGDNEAADVQGAARRGIAAIHYTLIPETIESPFHWESVRHGPVLPAIAAVRKLAGATMPAAVLHSEEDRNSMEVPALDSLEAGARSFFYRFGAEILGPFVQGFCDWVIDQCVAAGRREIHPLMREAHLLGPALERAARSRRLSISVQPLYVSRQATLLASMNDFTERELDQILGLGHITVGEVFHMLGVEAASLTAELPVLADLLSTPVEELHSVRSGETNERSWHDTLRRLLLQPYARQLALRSIRTQRERLLEHIRQQCGSPDQLITVDLGFNGTIQAAIDAAYTLERQKGDSIHLLAVGTERAALQLFRGTDIRCWIGPDTEGGIARRFARSPGLIEELMMGDFGSTVRYERNDDGSIVPVTAELNIPAEQLEYKRACQAGVMAFQSWYSIWLKAKPGLTAAAGHPLEWSLPLHRVLDMPTPEEASRLGDLVHQDNFGGVQTIRLCEPLSVEWETNGGDYLIDLSSFGADTANIFWPQGLVTRSEPYRLYVSFLRLRDAYGSAVIAFNTMNKLRREGIQSVMLLGKGEFAERLLQEALLQGIRIERILNSEPAEQTRADGTTNDSLPPAWEETIRTDRTGYTYVIGTLVRVQSCRRMLTDGYSRLNPAVRPQVIEPFV